MKRAASALLVLVMLLSLTACSNSGTNLLDYFGERYHYVKPSFGELTDRGSLTSEDAGDSDAGEDAETEDSNTDDPVPNDEEIELTAAVEYYVFGGATFYVDKRGSIVGIDLDFAREAEADLGRYNIAGIGANTSLGSASGKLEGDGTAADSAGYTGAKSFQDAENAMTITLYYDADEIVQRIHVQAN